MDYTLDAQTEQTAIALRLLAHPDRIKIILLLAENSSLNVSALKRSVNISQPLLSFHLTKMNNRGILVSKRNGKEIHYSLADLTIGETLQKFVKAKPLP